MALGEVGRVVGLFEFEALAVSECGELER